jgi:hypothetical protein
VRRALLLVPFLLAGCSPAPPGEDARVYAAAIQDRYPTRDRIVLLEHTVKPPDELAEDYRPFELPEGAPRDAYRASRAADDQPVVLEPFPLEHGRVEVVSDEIERRFWDGDRSLLDRLFRRPLGWKGFYRAFPGSQGILRLSRVGYSADGSVAALEAGNRSDSYTATDEVVVLEKQDGVWRVKTRIRTRIS